jgi:HSF-type DNA-binding
MDLGEASAPQNQNGHAKNSSNGGVVHVGADQQQHHNGGPAVQVTPVLSSMNQRQPDAAYSFSMNGSAHPDSIRSESGLPPSEAGLPTNDPMDLTSLKESVDAALASFQAPDSLPTLSRGEEDKQAQLRAMYLAGFRAAQSLPSAPSREDLTSREPDSAASDPTSGPASGVTMLLPLGAGVIQVNPLAAATGASPSSTSTISTTKVSESSFDTSQLVSRRITRTSSSGSAAASPLQSPPSSPATTGSNPFPRKLMDMLKKEDSSVVAWLPSGDAFIVRDVDKFVADILPRYFRHTKLTSFQRQLNLYGFRRVTKGPDSGAYRHEMFHREFPDRCLQMKRTKQKGSASPLLRGRARSNSVTSDTASPLMTPEQSPVLHALEPAVLSQSAPTILTSAIMGR